MLWSLSSGNHKVEAWVLLWFYLFSLLISGWEVEREICTLRERWLILLLCILETVPIFIWLYTWKTQKSQLKNYYRQKENSGTSLVVQWLMQGVFRGTSVLPMQGVGGLISAQGTRSHILQLRAGCSQQKLVFKRKFSYIVRYKIN